MACRWALVPLVSLRASAAPCASARVCVDCRRRVASAAPRCIGVWRCFDLRRPLALRIWEPLSADTGTIETSIGVQRVTVTTGGSPSVRTLLSIQYPTLMLRAVPSIILPTMSATSAAFESWDFRGAAPVFNLRRTWHNGADDIRNLIALMRIEKRRTRIQSIQIDRARIERQYLVVFFAPVNPPFEPQRQLSTRAQWCACLRHMNWRELLPRGMSFPFCFPINSRRSYVSAILC